MTAQVRDALVEAVAKGLSAELNIEWGLLLAPIETSVMPLYDRMIEEVSDQAAALHQRNRLYGKASSTIGQLRAENALLRQQLAAVRLGVTLAEPLSLVPVPQTALDGA